MYDQLLRWASIFRSFCQENSLRNNVPMMLHNLCPFLEISEMPLSGVLFLTQMFFKASVVHRSMYTQLSACNDCLGPIHFISTGLIMSQVLHSLFTGCPRQYQIEMTWLQHYFNKHHLKDCRLNGYDPLHQDLKFLKGR